MKKAQIAGSVKLENSFSRRREKSGAVHSPGQAWETDLSKETREFVMFEVMFPAYYLM